MNDSWFVGDAYDFTTSVPSYLASAGWTLKYRLVPQSSGSTIELVSTASGDDHRVTVASAESADWDAGDYSAFAWVENVAGEMHTVDPDVRSIDGAKSLFVRLIPNPREVLTYDGRSAARKALDALNAVLNTWGAKSHIQAYTIGSRSMTFTDKGQAMVMRDQLKAEVWREEETARLTAGLPGRRNIRIRMARV